MPPRRRVLRILACGLGAVAFTREESTAAPLLEWRGTSLGAETRILLRHAHPDRAHRALAAVLAEVERLEGEFSLHRAESAISRLNRDGRLLHPSLDMRHLLLRAARFGTLTGGAFDVTIQPLWQAVSDAATAGVDPDPRRLDAARRLVDFRAIDIDPAMLRFCRAGMAITLNGIAQGYITDRVADLLADCGMPDLLVDMGELRATNGQWRVALDHPARPRMDETLGDAGLATSAGAGSRFTADRRWHHIIDPRSATCPPAERAASVVAATATDADALATALTLLPAADAPALLRAAGAARAILSEPGHAPRRFAWASPPPSSPRP